MEVKTKQNQDIERIQDAERIDELTKEIQSLKAKIKELDKYVSFLNEVKVDKKMYDLTGYDPKRPRKRT